MSRLYRAITYRRGESYEAVCIDASGAGYGDTPEAAVADLQRAMAACHDTSKGIGVRFEREPTAAELEIVRCCNDRVPVDHHIIGVTTQRIRKGSKG